MPAGVEVVVDEGFATIDFVDPKLRGPALDKLLKIGGPETIEPLTREKGAERKLYRVPEGNAREAGLLDDDGDVAAEVVHVAADGTETPLVPDADGFVTLVSDGTGGGDGLLPPVVNDDPNSVPLTPLGEANEPAAQGDNENLAPAAPAEFPEGEPTTDWKLAELKAYASTKGIDAHELRTKAEVLALINAPGDNPA